MDIAELSMMLESMEPREVPEAEFMGAVTKAKGLKGLQQDQQLTLYGLFKQYTVGDNTTCKPDEADLVNKFKWDAWNMFKGFPKNNAALAYVFIVSQLLDNPAGGSEGGGPGVGCFGAIVSTLNRQYDQSLHWAVSEALFKCVVENDLAGVKTYVEQGEDVNAVNEDGMTALHYAADRGYNDIVACLLQHGAQVNAVDGSGQTALMYAVSCENKETVELLLQHGADCSIVDADGRSVREFEDVPEEIVALLLE